MHDFITSPASRHKSVVPDVGCLLALSIPNPNRNLLLLGMLQWLHPSCTHPGKARVKLLSRAFVDHLYTHLMADPSRSGLITTGLIAGTDTYYYSYSYRPHCRCRCLLLRLGTTSYYYRPHRMCCVVRSPLPSLPCTFLLSTLSLFLFTMTSAYYYSTLLQAARLSAPTPIILVPACLLTSVGGGDGLDVTPVLGVAVSACQF